MASNCGKQPSISKFFISANKSKSYEVNENKSVKRVKYQNFNNVNKKKAKFDNCRPPEEEIIIIDESSKIQSANASTFTSSPPCSDLSVRSKLESFRSHAVAKSNNREPEHNSHQQPSTLEGKNDRTHKVSTGIKYTPLEAQVVALKRNSPDTILFVECGYKYRFFGEDAQIAAKELNIVAHPDHNFQTASIPTHRLHIHVRRLVAKGYKVGVVKQTETAALKAIGANKTAPFSRELTAVYTKATLIGEDVSATINEGDVTDTTTSSLMILLESESSSAKDNQIGIVLVAVQPNTGEILYDHFDDSITRTGLWGRLEHIHPVEVVLSENISSTTLKTIKAVNPRHDDCIRIEKLSEKIFEYSSCLKELCQLFEGQEERLRNIIDLPHHVIRCLGATLHYLKEFKLERVIKAANIFQYSIDQLYMKLPGATLRNLEIVVNSDDGHEKGSLFWVLNHTNTKFGSRILRQWLVRPLLNIEKITERQDMIREFMTSEAPPLTCLKNVLTHLPDFQMSLTTIYHKKCSPFEFWTTTSGLSKVHQQLFSICSGDLSDVINCEALVLMITTAITKLSDIHKFSENINMQSAKENKKTELLKDWSKFQEVVKRREEIKQAEKQLLEMRSQIGSVLHNPSFDYTTVSGLEYLIEVKNNNLKSVPSNWNKVNSTKTCCRFRSPEVEKCFTKLQQLREQLQLDCNNAWLHLLDKFCENYQDYREAVRCLGCLDALISLAKVAKDNGYCRPEIIESSKAMLTIEGGKHPIVSQLSESSEQFVSNNTDLNSEEMQVMIVTGPNMGGKSCYIRQVALIALMSQVGSYVPADSVRMSIIDGIFTRMGATDEIFSGKSTFMIEVGETADIMQVATDRSLVILDELGKGTSTHDGMAIAMSTLNYFLQKNCLTIFVTHYLALAEFENLFPDRVGNFHMSFIVNEEDNDGIDVVTFLYQLTSGSAGQSYGLNVARLANVPSNILSRASDKSKSLEDFCTKKRRRKEQLRNLYFGSREDIKLLIKSLL